MVNSAQPCAPLGENDLHRVSLSKAVRLPLVILAISLVIIVQLLVANDLRLARPPASNANSTPCVDILAPLGIDWNTHSLFQSLQVLARQPIHARNHVSFRRALGCLIGKSQSGPWTRHSSVIGNLAVRWMSEYIDLAREKQVLVHHHISKCAGTAACDTASLNGCKTFSIAPKHETRAFYNRNLNQIPPEYRDVNLRHAPNCQSFELKDDLMWTPCYLTPPPCIEPGPVVDFPVGDDCADRTSFASKAGVNYLANENYLRLDEPCTGALIYTFLRDPVARIISHWSEADGEKVLGNLYRNQGNITVFDIGSAKHFRGVFDNYLIRSVAGSSSFFRPFGMIDRGDLEHAKKVLEFVDLLFVVGQDTVSDGSTISEKLFYKNLIGWRKHRGPEYVANPRGNDYGDQLNETAIAAFRKLNQLDQEFFEFGQELFRLDSAVYQIAQAACQNAFKSHRLPFSFAARKMLRGIACQVILSDVVIVPGQPPVGEEWGRWFGREKREREQAKIPFGCGCGWVGSTNTSTKVQPYYAYETGMPDTQTCPRVGVFE